MHRNVPVEIDNTTEVTGTELFAVSTDRTERGLPPLGVDDVVGALRARGILAAVDDGAVLGLPGAVLVQVGFDDEYSVLLVAADGTGAVAGPNLEELPRALTADLGVVVVVDDVAFVPGAEHPVPVDEDGPGGAPFREVVDTRVVYAWRGETLSTAGALAGGLGVPLGTYRVDGWTIAAQPVDEGVQLTTSVVSRAEHPFVVVRRGGGQRSVEVYRRAKAEDPDVAFTWNPALRHTTLPEPATSGEVAPDAASHEQAAPTGAAARVTALLRRPPVHENDLAASAPSLDPEAHRDLARIASLEEGTEVFAAVAERLDLPVVALAGALADGADDPTLPDPVAVDPGSLGALLRAEAGEDFRRELFGRPTGNGPYARLRRYFHDRPGGLVALGVAELATAGVLTGLALDPGTGSTVLVWVATGLFAVDGAGNTALGLALLRRRRKGSTT